MAKLKEVQVGEKYDVEILNITRDGQGVAYGPEGKIIMIDGVGEDDSKVRIEVVKVLEQMIFAKKYARLKEAQQQTGPTKSPYGYAEEDEEPEEEEGGDEEDEQDEETTENS